ncbi:putative intracellular serine protease [Triangularia verruculosa]|uniref:Intracellular serine protease n=1 Tax=Triangularia verruculosa TaxID=2587418 RepID=A0AAN6XAG1_9PEZI|nr:putative intracellular serine protease [Triangularia verruculosa]
MPDTLAAKDNEGNTALHHAVEYKRCREGQLAIVQLIVSRCDNATKAAEEKDDFNNQGRSPYLHHLHTRQEAIDKALRERKPKGATTTISHTNTLSEQQGSEIYSLDMAAPEQPPMMLINIKEAPGAETISIADDNWSKLGHRALAQSGLPPFHALSLEQPPSSTTASNAKDLATRAKKSESNNLTRPDKKIASEIERFLKLHSGPMTDVWKFYTGWTLHPVCALPRDMLTYSSRDLTRSCQTLTLGIFPPDVELAFDLSGYDDLSFSDKQFNTFLDKFEFSDVLQYVSIPRIPVITPKNRANDLSSSIVGRKDLIFAFDSLRRKGVKTIITVMVGDTPTRADRMEDLNIKPHTDEAIEAALKNFGLEVWDLKKPDICSEVILQVAPDVREVHLYWHGNNAVLRGWAEPGGLKKLTKLEQVFISIEERLESETRTDTYITSFVKRMEALCPKVKINLKQSSYRRQIALLNYPSRPYDQGKQRTKDEWINCMNQFHHLLSDAEINFKGSIDNRIGMTLKEVVEPGITIALIDDGVDFKDLPNCRFIGGQSFSTRDEDRNLIHPYYISSIGHGTTMARHIYYMCPSAKLYVLRLEDYHHPDDPNGRQITARSAAKAIFAAVHKNVDIISMSWTIEPSEPETRDDKQLEAAIKAAADKGILMFCSAPDRGAKQNATYPFKAAPGKTFTIGAASVYGNSVPSVGRLDGITFTLPGDKVSVPGSERVSLPFREPSGSSVATALGAGLAALILYCVKVHLLLTDSAEEKRKIQQDYDMLRKHENMLKAINGIGMNDTKFVLVWNVFGKVLKPNKKDWVVGNDLAVLVAEVGKIMCTKLL